jgi:hypothetical protein
MSSPLTTHGSKDTLQNMSLMQYQTATEGYRRRRDTRRPVDDRKSVVVQIVTTPERVPDARLLVTLVVAPFVGVVARLRKNKLVATLVALPHTRDRFAQECWIIDYLVVVDEERHVTPEHGRCYQADIAHCAVADEADPGDQVSKLELLQTAMQGAEFGRSEDERVDAGEVREDLTDAVLGRHALWKGPWRQR